MRSKLKDRKSHWAGTGDSGWLGKPDPPSPGAAPSISPATGSHPLRGSPRTRGHQPEGLLFSTLNLSIQPKRKQSSGDNGLSGDAEGPHPPAEMRMPSLLSCSHSDLGKAARSQGKVLVGLWRGTGREGGVAQPSRVGTSCCRGSCCHSHMKWSCSAKMWQGCQAEVPGTTASSTRQSRLAWHGHGCWQEWVRWCMVLSPERWRCTWDLMGDLALVTNSVPLPATTFPDAKAAAGRLPFSRKASLPCAASASASMLMSFTEFIPLQNPPKKSPVCTANRKG